MNRTTTVVLLALALCALALAPRASSAGGQESVGGLSPADIKMLARMQVPVPGELSPMEDGTLSREEFARLANSRVRTPEVRFGRMNPPVGFGGIPMFLQASQDQAAFFDRELGRIYFEMSVRARLASRSLVEDAIRFAVAAGPDGSKFMHPEAQANLQRMYSDRSRELQEIVGWLNAEFMALCEVVTPTQEPRVLLLRHAFVSELSRACLLDAIDGDDWCPIWALLASVESDGRNCDGVQWDLAVDRLLRFGLESEPAVLSLVNACARAAGDKRHLASVASLASDVVGLSSGAVRSVSALLQSEVAITWQEDWWSQFPWTRGWDPPLQVLDRLEQYDAARQLLGEHEDLRLLADSTRQRLIESRWELLDLFVAQTARYLESGLKRRLFEEERFQVAADRVLRARFSALLEFCASFESLIAGDLTGEDADEVRRLLADTNDASLVALSVFDGKSRVGNGHWASRGLGMSRWGNWLSYIDSGVLPERDIRNLP